VVAVSFLRSSNTAFLIAFFESCRALVQTSFANE
jgi:hypothetical protein